MTLQGALAILAKWRKTAKRLKAKDIETNYKGEGLTKGGVIIFAPDGTPKYAYYEETGKELPVQDIMAAVEAMKQG